MAFKECLMVEHHVMIYLNLLELSLCSLMLDLLLFNLSMANPSKMVKQTKSNKKLNMYISVQLSLSNWSLQQARRTDSTRLDWSKPQLTQELVSLFLLYIKQTNFQSKILSRNDSGQQLLVSSSPTLKQQQVSVSLNYILIN